MFERFYITSKGKMVEARTHAGEAITFTRMQVGDGVLQSGQSIEALTELISPIKYIPVSSAKSNGLKAVVTGDFSNKDIASSFLFREIGLFADDPIDGEVLYAYAYAGANPDSIPAHSTAVVEFSFAFNISFTNTGGAITVNIDSSLAFVTQRNMLLVVDSLEDAIITPTFDSSGNIIGSTHKVNGETVRTDTITVTASTATEVRVLNTGERLTITTDLTTKETTLVYDSVA